MKSKWISSLMGLGLATALTTGSVAQAQEPVELTFSVWIPQTHILVSNFMIPWAEEVEEATEGRVKVSFLPKPVTNPVGHFDAVRNGLVDLAFISHSYYPGRFDLMKFGILPFSGNSAETNSIATWRIYDKYLREANEHRGVKLLGVYAHGPGAVFTTDRVVDGMDDFDGLKLRIGGGIQADLAKALDFNAVVKPAPESYELMSTGVVDGVLFPPESVASFQLDTVVKNATFFPGGLYSDNHGIIMNESAFERLSEQDQKILLDLSGEHIARMGGKAWGDADVAALESLEAKGVVFHDADEQFVADVRDRTQVFEETWLATAKERGIDGPKVLEEFRAELEALESQQQ